MTRFNAHALGALYKIIKAPAANPSILRSHREVFHVISSVIVRAQGLHAQGLDLVLLSPKLGLTNQFLATVLLALAQTLQVLLRYFWCIFPVHKVMLCYRYMMLFELFIYPSAIPEYFLGLQVINLLWLVLFDVLYSFFKRESIGVETYEDIAPMPFLKVQVLKLRNHNQIFHVKNANLPRWAC